MTLKPATDEEKCEGNSQDDARNDRDPSENKLLNEAPDGCQTTDCSRYPFENQQNGVGIAHLSERRRCRGWREPELNSVAGIQQSYDQRRYPEHGGHGIELVSQKYDVRIHKIIKLLSTQPTYQRRSVQRYATLVSRAATVEPCTRFYRWLSRTFSGPSHGVAGFFV